MSQSPSFPLQPLTATGRATRALSLNDSSVLERLRGSDVRSVCPEAVDAWSGGAPRGAHQELRRCVSCSVRSVLAPSSKARRRVRSVLVRMENLTQKVEEVWTDIFFRYF